MHYLISVEDVDGDDVRCRWSESSLRECSGVCWAFPATLDEVFITIIVFMDITYVDNNTVEAYQNILTKSMTKIEMSV